MALVRGAKGSQAEPACGGLVGRRPQPELSEQDAWKNQRRKVTTVDRFVSRGNKDKGDRHAVEAGEPFSSRWAWEVR